MKTPLLLKIAFWMTVVGLAALLAPNPAWHPDTARFVMSLGIALGITTLLVPFIKRRKPDSRDGQRKPPQ